jgi:CheY-like chemotaxis protein
VLRNLISNAIKYTQSGSVELRCERDGTRLRVEIRDTGVGIAADQVPHIFEEFYQIGVSPNSSRQGYGLGLSIVQRIAKLLDLKISVRSTPGHGSVFAFELPAARSARAVSAETSDEPGTDPNADGAFHVLLVEDEPGVRNAMRVLFKIEGFHVTAVAGAAEALALLHENADFDLIVTDFHLEGDRTGTEVISAARRVFGNSMKAILVTGDTSSVVRELQADANLRVASKPVNSKELLALVSSLLAE